jgi:hypothetical protein
MDVIQKHKFLGFVKVWKWKSKNDICKTVTGTRMAQQTGHSLIIQITYLTDLGIRSSHN